MTRPRSLLTALALLLGLSGCCPDGCFVLSGEAYRKLAYPPPLRDQWVKSDASKEQRAEDWRFCGGSKDGNFAPDPIQVQRKREPNEPDVLNARGRLYADLQRCMLRNGYRYAGKCYDNNISRSMPACGAP